MVVNDMGTAIDAAFADMSFTDIQKLNKALLIERARREGPDQFYNYCRATTPGFYDDAHAYLEELCYQIQAFLESDEDIFVLNMGPRFGKTTTVTKAVEWLLGKKPWLKVMTGSYNEDYAKDIGDALRNSIKLTSESDTIITYNDIYTDPDSQMGDKDTQTRWRLQGSRDGRTTFLATSPKGSATGFGANVLIVDDLIKSHEEAFDNKMLEKHWRWFNDTLLSRLEGEYQKIIFVMTRWSDYDLSGYALRELKDAGYKVRHHVAKAYDAETDTMLCDTVLSKEKYERNMRTMDPVIFTANYLQEPVTARGKLYDKPFQVYSNIDNDYISNAPTPIENPKSRSFAYIDTADRGKDYLSLVIWREYNSKHYVQDVLYTQESMDVTEKKVSDILNSYSEVYGRLDVFIESNNGGRIFAKNIDKRTNSNVNIKDFTQSKNKEARIIVNSAKVNNDIIFPIHWRASWPQFYNEVMNYQRIGRNAHDDAVDTLTGIVEKMDEYTYNNQNTIYKSNVYTMRRAFR